MREEGGVYSGGFFTGGEGRVNYNEPKLLLPQTP